MTQTAVRAGAYIHHLAFESEEPAKLAGFYVQAMQMSGEQTGEGEWVLTGPERQLVISQGQPRKLSYAGFAVRSLDDLEDIRARAETEGLEVLPSPTRLFGNEAFSIMDPDGNRIAFGLSRRDRGGLKGIHGPVQHLTFATLDVPRLEAFYVGKLGFSVTDRVVKDDGEIATAFFTSNHEHHTIACFKSQAVGVDHHSYEAGQWTTIGQWCDHFGDLAIPLMWGPGRHGPGNNIFIFITDPDGNWIEVSAELEVIHDRPVKHWPHAERTLNLWGRGILRS